MLRSDEEEGQGKPEENKTMCGSVPVELIGNITDDTDDIHIETIANTFFGTGKPNECIVCVTEIHNCEDSLDLRSNDVSKETIHCTNIDDFKRITIPLVKDAKALMNHENGDYGDSGFGHCNLTIHVCPRLTATTGFKSTIIENAKIAMAEVSRQVAEASKESERLEQEKQMKQKQKRDAKNQKRSEQKRKACDSEDVPDSGEKRHASAAENAMTSHD